MGSGRASERRVASGKWARFCLLFFVFGLFFLVSCSTGAPVLTEHANEGGIAVAPEFAEFYTNNGEKRFFGEPITEGFVAGDNGRFTQYFQNMRLEYDETAGTIIFPLGEWALTGVTDPKPVSTAANSRSRTFPDSNLTVQDEFLLFYETYNGEQLLGVPISSQMDEGDLRVQYFVNGRLEWHPELDVNQRIQVGPLGRDHFWAVGGQMYMELDARPVFSAGIEQVDVYTAVEKAVLYSDDTQTLYVTVLTPGLRPVDGIAADVMITFGETTAVLDLGTTDGDGRIVVPLNNLAIPSGQTVELLTSVYASDGQIIGQSMLTFQTWW